MPQSKQFNENKKGLKDSFNKKDFYPKNFDKAIIIQ